MELMEEMLESGRTPEEACAGCPELLNEVRERLRRCGGVDAELDALFPSWGESPAGTETVARDAAAELPQVPGYDVESVVGRGGMGVVYKARHLALNRPVALKMVLVGAYASATERQRLLREAKAFAALRHPNIVTVYDVGECDGKPFFTMELMEGGTLAHRLSGTPQPARDAATAVVTLATGVHAAHEAGIIHRDLKPGNVLIGADGALKITDFGLAWHLEAEATLTLTGVPLGTPSYMAPEQARGERDAIGPSVDVYSLGALLYEMLTGRPPFRGETALETQRQVLEDEPAPPSRLNSKIPSDVETICLKCLQKVASRRYKSAQDLANDLRRFLNHEPILARRIGRTARVLRWIRRKPTTAALVATAAALVALAVGGEMRQAERRAELRTGVRTAVDQAQSLRRGFHFQEARALLEQARQRLDPAGPNDLRRQVDQEQADLKLVEDLDTARLRAAVPVEGRFETAGADSQYAESKYQETFAKARFGGPGDDIEVAAARVRDSAMHVELVAALDDWASITPDGTRRAWLLAVARAADRDTARNRLRQPKLWEDGAGLAKLVDELPVDELSPQLTTALGRVLLKSGGDAVPLLIAAQKRDPQDFWLNFELGWALFVSHRSDEALGFYRAALALRPDSSSAHNGVGATLSALGRWDEAIAQFDQALKIDPDFAMVHAGLGFALWTKGRKDEAIGHYQEAIRIGSDPMTSAWAHNSLGLALWNKDQRDEAIGHYEESIRLHPKVGATAHRNLALALWELGRQDEAIHHYEESIRVDPKGAALAHNNLALALWGRNRREEAIGHYQEAIRLDPKASAITHVNLGLALRDMGRLDEAISHLEESIRLEPKASAVAHYSLGLALRESGQIGAANTHFQQAIQLESRSTLSRDNLFNCYYAAACGAVRDSASEGSPQTPLREKGRARLRRQALDWLRAAVELRIQQSKVGKPVGSAFTTWKTDSALTSVREQAALAKLPDAEREEWQRLWVDVEALLTAHPVEQGRSHAARGDWAAAVDDYGRALRLGPMKDGDSWFEYAAVLLLSGDRVGYGKVCDRMIERCGKTPDLRAYHVARACTLAPDAVQDASLPASLAASELKSTSRQFWSLTQQGALHYRAGRFAEAVPLFEKSLAADSKPGRAVLNWLWLALANERLGKHPEARQWLNKATGWLDQFTNGMPASAEAEFGLHLHNWLEAQILRREAEAAIAAN
jgi:serine/threonine-protein kinase